MSRPQRPIPTSAVCTLVRACVRARARMCACARMCARMHANVRVLACTSTCACMCAHVHVHACVRVRVCMQVPHASLPGCIACVAGWAGKAILRVVREDVVPTDLSSNGNSGHCHQPTRTAASACKRGAQSVASIPRAVQLWRCVRLQIMVRVLRCGRIFYHPWPQVWRASPA